MASFTDFFRSLDPDAGKRGKQFEHFVKWFLKNDPEWSTQVDQVWLWDEYPNSWGRDCGIDLVFKHKNGENWAVQAKCYASTTRITKGDVDSFISESSRDGIDKRLLIATTDLLAPIKSVVAIKSLLSMPSLLDSLIKESTSALVICVVGA
jgi:predicted helicase